MKVCDARMLEEMRRMAEQTVRLSEEVARLDERVGGFEDKFTIFLRDHNDLVRLKSQWKLLAGLSAFFGSAFVTMLVHYLRGTT
ncbi:MAG: hypothetical protein NOU37_08310 [Candidatus Brocadiales bacterium]|nr:hypothetical protein [Candidatus Bathyanammoxibius sp.]MCQ4575233.1 hypothetical protein [Candidatus Bathyanammoxibius amoris]